MQYEYGNCKIIIISRLDITAATGASRRAGTSRYPADA